MSGKEISVLIIGLFLVGFLYVMKNPDTLSHTNAIQQTEKSIGIDIIVDNQQPDFNPNTTFPTLENILDIPAWEFDIAKLEVASSEELISAINQALEQQRYFQPEGDNALYYLVNLKSIDPDNQQIAEFDKQLNQELLNQAQLAIKNNHTQALIATIARTKTLDKNSPNLKYLKSKLATIKTINKLYNKGNSQILNNLIVTEDSIDAWHTAKQSIEIDPANSKTQQLVAKVNGILIDNALRAAEESDFNFAQNYLDQAQLLTPESSNVAQAQARINELKQQRYIWLEQQLTLALERINIPRAQRMLTQLAEIGIQKAQLDEYQLEINRVQTFGKYAPLDTFNDTNQSNQQLPTMVVMQTGRYIMGNNDGPKHEKPAHWVSIDYGFAVSQNEISVHDFSLFMDSSDYKTDAEKNNNSRIYDLRTGRLKNKSRVNWRKDYLGKKAKTNNPVIHISWNDALAYSQWLSAQTGKNYRLLSEAEFEYVLRAGSHSRYPWGEGSPTRIIENLTGKLDKSKVNSRIKWKKGFDKYNDKYWGPAPVGSFISNPFKLNDTAGNVMEWVMDCWHDSYVRAPIDGSPWVNPGCESHVIRGGSWSSAKNEFTVSHRFKAKAAFTDARLGFRIALDL